MPTLTTDQISVYAQAAGFTGQSLIDAVSTAMAESSGRTDVVNAFGNTGLMQVGAKGTAHDAGVGLTESQLKDPGTNMSAAHAIWARDGGTFAKEWSTWGGAEQTLWAVKLGGAAPAPGAAPASATTISDCSKLMGVGKKLCEMQPAPGDSGSGNIDIGALITDAGKGAAWVANPTNWLHVIYIVAGIGVALVGLNILAKPLTGGPIGSSARTVAKTTAKVAAL